MTTHVEPTVLNGSINPFYTAQGGWNVSTQPGTDGKCAPLSAPQLTPQANRTPTS